MKYGLLGHPLGHSMSPFIHQKLFELSGIKASYELFDVPPEKLDEKKDFLLSLDGFNVTIPYKGRVIDFLGKLDISASRYNSVNVVKTGEVNVGYNTDVNGFVASVIHMGATLSGNVLLLGSGGVSRMMAAETILAGGKLTVGVRDANSQKTKEFLSFLKGVKQDAFVKAVDINETGGGYDLVINGTPVGMFPKTQFSPMAEQDVKSCKFVFDAIYNPEETLLYKYAEKNGVKCVTGMEMLVRQAAEAHRIWYGANFDESEIKNIIRLANEELKKR